jgi:hypothetical protein
LKASLQVAKLYRVLLLNEDSGSCISITDITCIKMESGKDKVVYGMMGELLDRYEASKQVPTESSFHEGYCVDLSFRHGPLGSNIH